MYESKLSSPWTRDPGDLMFENRYNDLTVEDLKILLHEVKLELMIMGEEE